MAVAMLLFDVLLRFSAITLLVLIAILSLRDARHLIQGRIAVILCITLASMLLTTAPPELRPAGPAYAMIRLVDTANLVFLWWFGLSLFEDDFRLRRLHWMGLGIYLVVGLPLRVEHLMGADILPFVFDIVIRVVSVAMILHLLWTALSGWRDDLIAVRRRTRLWYTAATALAALIIVGGEIAYTTATGDRSDPVWLSTSRVAVALPAICYGAWWFLQFRADGLLFEPSRPVAASAPSIDVRDRASHQRLLAAMVEDHVYREPRLSIGSLAARINVPEHQLRALINKGLGFRNFAAFLNTYRLADAKAALADPEQARTQILTIAMDVGYGSLATFNRAFKQAEGVTPSEYRISAHEDASQS